MSKNRNKKLNKALFSLSIKIILLAIVYLNVSALLNKEQKIVSNATREYFSIFEYSAPMVLVPKKKDKVATYNYNSQVPVEVVKDEIKRQAKEFGLGESFMLQLADDESDFNNLARNPKSTAVGVFQYLIGTWYETESWKNHHIARTDYKANIREAMIDISNGETFRWAESL